MYNSTKAKQNSHAVRQCTSHTAFGVSMERVFGVTVHSWLHTDSFLSIDILDPFNIFTRPLHVSSLVQLLHVYLCISLKVMHSLQPSQHNSQLQTHHIKVSIQHIWWLCILVLQWTWDDCDTVIFGKILCVAKTQFLPKVTGFYCRIILSINLFYTNF